MATYIRTLNGTLSFDPYLIGSYRTSAYDAYITDSAAAATSYASGIKTLNNAIGIFPNATAVGTIMEAAHRAGVKCGLICTSNLNHATPASFNSHSKTRYLLDFIAEQQVDSEIPLMLGGGIQWFNKTNVYQKAVENNYDIIYTKSQLFSTSSLPVLGLFAQTSIAYEIDRVEEPEQPSLLEMTENGIRLLSANSNDNGFFVMIEGSKIDWAEHGNDPVATYSEGLEYAKVFQYVINYALTNKDTLVIATADHETGGLSLGLQPFGENDSEAYEWYPEVIKNVTRTGEFIATKLYLAPNDQQIVVDIFENYTSLNLTTDEINNLMTAKLVDFYTLNNAISVIISQRARIGWTTVEHSGSDVNVYGYGPSIEYFCGNRENTEFYDSVLKIFNWDVASITNELRDFNTTG